MVKKLSFWLVLLITTVVSACEEEYETSSGRTKMEITLYRLNDTSSVHMGVSDTLLIYPVKLDTLLTESLDSTSNTYSLPLSYLNDSTAFVLQEGYKKNVVHDTLIVKFTSWVHFLSMDQGTVMYYNIKNARVTNHFINSLSIINKDITENEKENIRLYYKVSK